MNTSFLKNGDYPCGKVLVVDDEENNRMLLRDSLEAQGHTVAEAISGARALAALAEDLPDVVLLDVMMPQMDGFQVCRTIKGTPDWAHVPVILVTALTERKERLTGMQAGANDFLTKPIDLTDVILRVRNAVQIKRLFDSAQEQFRQASDMKALQQKLTHLVIRELRPPLASGLRHLQELKEKTGGQWTKKDSETVQEAWESFSAIGTRIEQLIGMGNAVQGNGDAPNVVDLAANAPAKCA